MLQYLFDHDKLLTTLIAGAVSLLVGIITAVVTLRIAKQRAAVDFELARRREEVDERLKKLEGEIGEQKIRLEERTLFQAERVAYELLRDARWPTRRFQQIRHHIGGFDDQELRKILVRAGALRFGPRGANPYGPQGDSNTELWGLIERNRDRLQKASVHEQAAEADDLE
jgi:hypothetical protein